MVQLTDKHWAVEVPDDAQELEIRHDKLIWVVKDSVNYENLTEGTWQYLFTTKGATEEDFRSQLPDILNADFVYFHEYMFAFSELLKEKGCDDKKNWAIIQKLNDNG